MLQMHQQQLLASQTSIPRRSRIDPEHYYLKICLVLVSFVTSRCGMQLLFIISGIIFNCKEYVHL